VYLSRLMAQITTPLTGENNNGRRTKMFGKSKSLILGAALLVGTSLGAMAGTLTPLSPLILPGDGIIYGFLLTDGSILFQGGLLQDFYRFKPDKKGSYVNGTFFNAAALPPNYVPYATSGGVLPDGRVLLIGGEYLLKSQTFPGLFFEFTNKMAIYDPQADKWTMVAPPFGPDWDFIGDSPWTLLPNGHLLLGEKFTKAMAEFDPATLTWTHVSSHAKDDRFAEEGLTLLPDGSVLTVNMTDFPFSQRWIPNANPSNSFWVDAGSTPARLAATDNNGAKNIRYDNNMRVYHPPGEIGPGMLRPDGTVFYTGAACDVPGPSTDKMACVTYQPQAHTAIYDTKTGTWAPGPDIPKHEGAGDTFASLLPGGNVFMQTNPPGTNADRLARANARYASIRNGTMHPLAAEGQALQQSTCPPGVPVFKAYEFDGTNLTHEPAADFCGAGPSLLLLPTGNVMMNGQAVYFPSGRFENAWRPTITQLTFSDNLNPGGKYQIFGKQFNGLSTANAFGDEFGVQTNFPLVRIKNNATGDVKYARTYNFSTMAVATGSAIVSTWFDVPTNTELGDSTLEVVANGIPSLPMNVSLKPGGALSQN
jgi:hypothetical protein